MADFFFMWKESVRNRLPLFTFNMFFLTWKTTLALERTRSPMSRRCRSGVAHVSQTKLHPSIEVFPKTETDFSSAHLPSSCFFPRDPRLLWFQAAQGPKRLWGILTSEMSQSPKFKVGSSAWPLCMLLMDEGKPLAVTEGTRSDDSCLEMKGCRSSLKQDSS